MVQKLRVLLHISKNEASLLKSTDCIQFISYMFSYSAISEQSGITDNATAFIGCDNGKVLTLVERKVEFVALMFFKNRVKVCHSNL